MEVPIIREVVIIFALSIAVLLVCHRLKLPPVVAFLITGILCGPHGLAFVGNIDDVERLATIGVVLLLFTVGMEFSIQNIVKYRTYFFGGGAFQVFGTIFACYLIGSLAFGSTLREAIFLGFLISLSSTAIVLRMLDDKGDSESPHGRLILGILIFQDIVAVPMMLLVPVLAGTGEEGIDFHQVINFAKGMGIFLVMAYAAFRAVPKLLYYVTRTRNRELFLLSVLTICFAVAWFTSSLGLSLSLGAFLAGLVVSESEYSDEAVGNVLPFQTIFTSFFFVSMGMLLDLSFVMAQPFLILGIACAVMLLKALIAGSSAIVLGMPLRAAVLAGVGLCQVGEFAFILALTGMQHGIMTDYYYQLFLSVSLLTMGVMPTLMSLAPAMAQGLGKLPLPKRFKTGLHYGSHTQQERLHDHLIIAGFGLRGRHLAEVSKQINLPYVILEMNPKTVKEEKLKGEPIRYGDPSHHAVMHHAGIKEAKMVAVVINDPKATMQIVKMARELNPNVYIITRTRYFFEVGEMVKIGADDVVPDELGSSLEIFTRVLHKCDVSQDQIDKCVTELRLEGSEPLRWRSLETKSTVNLEVRPQEP